jgi:cytochrome-b5 reductase
MPNTTLLLLGVGVAGALVLAYFLLRKKGEPKSIDPREYRSFQLVHKENVSPNTIRYTFALPSSSHRLGLPVGKHISIKAQDSEGKDFMRNYTPITGDEVQGYFKLVIKVYPQGKMSRYLEQLPLKGKIDVRGPQGALEYKGHGVFEIKRKTGLITTRVKRVGMLAGGTGITPMYQLIHAVLRDPKDTTELSLIFGNITEQDILLREELEKKAAEHKKQFRVYFVLDKPNPGWEGGSGFITPDMISKHLPPPSPETLVLMCGPPPMMNVMVKHMQTLDYSEDQFFQY